MKDKVILEIVFFLIDPTVRSLSEVLSGSPALQSQNNWHPKTTSQSLNQLLESGVLGSCVSGISGVTGIWWFPSSCVFRISGETGIWRFLSSCLCSGVSGKTGIWRFLSSCVLRKLESGASWVPVLLESVVSIESRASCSCVPVCIIGDSGHCVNLDLRTCIWNFNCVGSWARPLATWLLHGEVLWVLNELYIDTFFDCNVLE